MPEPPPSWRTTDLVRRHGPREFAYLGRSSRLVKANGVRIWLDEVETAVTTALPGLDVACLPVPDRVRRALRYCGPWWTKASSSSPTGSRSPPTAGS
ncbi:hypothetical protein SGLAM104S_07893 [Streptomyces glaucescens]